MQPRDGLELLSPLLSCLSLDPGESLDMQHHWDSSSGLQGGDRAGDAGWGSWAWSLPLCPILGKVHSSWSVREGEPAREH